LEVINSHIPSCPGPDLQSQIESLRQQLCAEKEKISALEQIVKESPPPSKPKVKVKKSPSNKKIYRSVRNRVELSEEKPEQIEEKIRVAEGNINALAQNFDVSVKGTTDEIEKQFAILLQSRTYKKSLFAIKECRGKLLGKLNLPAYIKMIERHISRLENTFTKKKHEKKKMLSNISQALSPLDQRLVFYGNYYDTTLEADHIQQLKLSLKVNMSYSCPKRYVPFNHTDLYDKLYNYSMAICPIKETLARALVNPFGFSNVVYLDLGKSTETDPYSFYSLEKIESDGRRCWKMECRLDDFSRNLATHMKTYCVELFRKIYSDVFHDNYYREDYHNKAPICHQDCEQLLMNILLLSKTKTFCELLQGLIIKNCTMHPTELDKFNLTGDDKLHKRQFAQEKDSEDDMTTTIKRLFDELSDDDAKQIWEGCE